MRFTKKPQGEPIPGYRLLELMGSGGFGEVWKCEAPGGLLKAIKFVRGHPGGLGGGRAPAQEELAAVQRVKAIRHPFLLSMERVESLGGELIIVMELADKNLHDRQSECTAAGLPGVPREELLAYLTEAAEALDLMNIQHNLQHLDIKPHNLFLVSNHVKVGDFGLVQSMGGQAEALSVTPLYAAPETFQGKVSPHSDQYSLAIVYQELLTGALPFTGKNVRQLLMLHTKGEPDLSSLPERDRPAVAKALAKDPQARFPTCGHFVRALVSGWIPNQLVAVAGGGEPVPSASRVDGRLAAAGANGCHGQVREGEAPAEPSSTQYSVLSTQYSATRPKPLPPPSGQHANGHAPTVKKGPVTEPLDVTIRRAPSLTHTTRERWWSLEEHELHERIRGGPLSEVWRATTARGSRRLVTQVFGWAWRGADELEATLARWQAARHPVLLEADVLHTEPGRLVFTSAPVERTLRERLRECQTAGLAGVPRAELLGYLAGAAAGLDELYRAHGLVHLGPTPRHLVLDDGRLRVVEFGLTQLFWLPAVEPAACLNVRYAAPELYAGQVGPACDQYSLGRIYCELRTGRIPPRGALRPADLETLSGEERAAVGRALEPDPARRWPTCADFVRALGGPARAVSDSAPLTILPETAGAGATPAAGGLQGRFTTHLSAGDARARIEHFQAQWNAEMLGDEETSFLFHIALLGNLWQESHGRQPRLEVQVRLRDALSASGAPTEVGVHIRPVECSPDQEARFLHDMGNLLFESLQAHLQAVPQRRAEERLPWHYPLQLRIAHADGRPDEVIECQGKDISLNGIGFYTPREPRASQVSLSLPPSPQTPRVTTTAALVRVQHCGAGWYEVGAILLSSAPRAKAAELPDRAGVAG